MRILRKMNKEVSEPHIWDVPDSWTPLKGELKCRLCRKVWTERESNAHCSQRANYTEELKNRGRKH